MQIENQLKKIDRYIEKADYQKAKLLLIKLRKKMPGNRRVAVKLSEVYLYLNCVDEARSILRRILESEPGHVDAIELYGIVSLMSRQYKKAEEQFKLLLDRGQAQSAYYGFSALHAGRGEIATANQYSRKAIELLPVHVPTPGGKPVVLVLHSLGKNFFELTGSDYSLDLVSNNMYKLVAEYISIVDLFVEKYEANTGLIDKIPEIDLIYNGIADLDDSKQAFKAVKEIIKHIDKPVINPLLEDNLVSRDTNFSRLKDIDGILFPATVKINLTETDEKLFARIMGEYGLGFPVLIRVSGTHVGKTFEKLHTLEAYEQYRQENKNTKAYVSQYYELGRDGIYRRFRIFCINGAVCPGTVFYGKGWNVHRRSNFNDVPSRYMEIHNQFCNHFDRFIEPFYPAVREIVKRTPMEFFGIDFDVLDSGEIIVFEVNAAMNVGYSSPSIKEILKKQIVSLFEKKLKRQLAGPAGTPLKSIS